MTSKQKKAAREFAAEVKRLAEQTNAVRVQLEELGREVFLDASCEGKADGYEVRDLDEGNNRLAQIGGDFLIALAFYAELTGDKTLEEVREGGASRDERSATSRRISPTVGEVKAPKRPISRDQRGEVRR